MIASSIRVILVYFCGSQCDDLNV